MTAPSARSNATSRSVYDGHRQLSPTRLAHSWPREGEAEITQVAIELEALDEVRTQVVVTHSANPSTVPDKS